MLFPGCLVMFLRPDRGCGRDGGVGSGSGAEDAKAAWADDASRWWFFGGRGQLTISRILKVGRLCCRVVGSRRAVDKQEQRGPRRRAGSSGRDGEGEVWVSAATGGGGVGIRMDCLAGPVWVWEEKSGVEAPSLSLSLSLCALFVPGAAAANARCKVPGVEGVPSKHQSSAQAPSTPQEWARFVDF